MLKSIKINLTAFTQNNITKLKKKLKNILEILLQQFEKNIKNL